MKNLLSLRYNKKYKKQYDISYRIKNTEKRKKQTTTYYQKNKDVVLAKNKKRRDALRQRVINFLGEKCQYCSFSDYRALHIDHIYGDGRKDRNGKTNGFLNKVLNTKEKKYQLLCANCNAIKQRENKEYGNGRHNNHISNPQ